MNNMEQLDFLVNELVKEERKYKGLSIPEDYDGKRKLLRSLIDILSISSDME